MARTRRANAEGHVGVFRVGDDECARTRIAPDFRKLAVERLHEKLQAPSSKLQINPKLQFPKPRLELGFWSLSGAWKLEVGAFIIMLVLSKACPEALWRNFARRAF